MDDAGRRRDDRKSVERLLAEAEERVALAVALELELGVRAIAPRDAEGVHLDGVVDDEVRRQLGVDAHWVAAEVAHRVAHGDEVDDRRHAGEVLVEDARRREAELAGRLVARHPAGDGLTSASVPVRSAFSSRIRSVNGRRATSCVACSASSRKIS